MGGSLISGGSDTDLIHGEEETGRREGKGRRITEGKKRGKEAG